MRSLLTAFFLLIASLTHAATEVYYSFVDGDEGGLAVVRFDSASSKVVEHLEVFRSAEATDAKKVAATQDGRYSILVAVREDEKNAYITGPDGNTRVLDLANETDEVRISGTRALVGANQGMLHLLDLPAAKTLHTWDFRQLLNPSGRKPEDIAVVDGGRRAWLSFQKDSRGGKHLGSRLVLINLENLAVEQDIQLPRNRPELHYDLPRDRRERGPSPEVLVVSPVTNTLFVTLDLYGAVAMMDLDAAERGEMRNWVYLPTSLDESWGTAFPDRVGRFTWQGREMVLVANAGEEGGALVVDLAKRRIVQRLPVRHGLTTLSFLPEHGLMVAGVEGKVKRRGPEGLEKEDFPGRELPVFRLTDDAEAPLTFEMVPFPGHVYQVVAIPHEERPLTLISFGEEAPNTWLLYDINASEVLQEIPAKGSIIRTFKR